MPAWVGGTTGGLLGLLSKLSTRNTAFICSVFLYFKKKSKKTCKNKKYCYNGNTIILSITQNITMQHIITRLQSLANNHVLGEIVDMLDNGEIEDALSLYAQENNEEAETIEQAIDYIINAM